eukprot:SAG31_NODE_4458_length_3212_cov_1.665918_2_plen_191_part_00
MVNIVEKNVPRQDNGSDCGVFLLEYAERFVTDLHRILPQGEVPLQTYLDKTELPNWFGDSDVMRFFGQDKRATIKSIIDQLCAVTTSANTTFDQNESNKTSANCHPRRGYSGTTHAGNNNVLRGHEGSGITAGINDIGSSSTSIERAMAMNVDLSRSQPYDNPVAERDSFEDTNAKEYTQGQRKKKRLTL